MREEFYPEVLRRLGISIGSRDLCDTLARRAVGPGSFQCFADTLATLDSLCSMGLRLEIVSNALASAPTQLKHLGHWSQVKPFGDLSRAKPAKIGPILDEFYPADRRRRTN
jgi:hypothetical protein